MSKLSNRITVMLLSGMLVIGSVPGSVLAASTDVASGQTSEAAEDVFTEEISEIPAAAGETSEAGEDVLIEDTSETPAAAGETSEAGEDVLTEETAESPEFAGESYSGDASAEEEEQYYTVTLDANGGFFENEWDDALGDTIQQAEVVEKHIPVDGTVAAFPVFTDQDGQSMIFAGWSLERDGELIIAGDEEYAPVDSCILYAVWQAAESEDAAPGENGEQEAAADEITEQTDSAQETEEAETSEKSADTGDAVTAEHSPVAEDAASEADHDPEAESEQAAVPDQEAAPAVENIENEDIENEDIEKAGGISSDTAEAGEEIEPELNESSQEEETVREAAKGVVDSGTCGENVTWTLDENGTLTISGTGKMEDYKQSSYPFMYDDIKTVIIKNGVTSIGDWVFLYCRSMTRVEIPQSVTRIGAGSFCCCSSLETITLPANVTSIGDYAFQSCPLSSITIPDAVTSIGAAVFENCVGLETITLPANVTSIGNNLFYGCSNLETVTLPDGVTSIGKYAFGKCSSLTGITLPKDLTSIDQYAFYLSSLESIEIPKGVTSIGNYAFYLSSLESITLSEDLTSIGNRAFSGCKSLKAITLPDGVNSIGWAAFEDCSSLKSIVIPKDVTSIGTGMFINCSSLESIEIPESVTSIGEEAFQNCSSLKSIVIPKDVTSIGTGMFINCSSLTSVEIPVGLTDIGIDAFSGCSSLKSIEIPERVTSIGWQAFEDCSSLESITIPGGVTSISSHMCTNCSSLKNVTIPKGVTIIDWQAFENCSSLTKITLPDSVNTISFAAFRNCSKLTSITIPDSVTDISSSAFNGCPDLVISGYSGSKAQEYAKQKNIPFLILIDRASVTIPGQPYTYTGDSIEPEVTVILNETKLTQGTDYTVDCSNNIDVGTAAVTVTGTGSYAGIKELTFDIGKAVQTITASDLSLAYPESRKITVSGCQGDLSYTSLDQSVAEVDISGNVTAKRPGTTTITIAAAGTKNYYEAEKDISVTVAKGIQPIKASNLSLTFPNSGKITVSGNEGKVTYKSSNTAVAAVDSAGKVTAKGGGTAKITITAAETDYYKETTKEITVDVAKTAQSITASDLSLTYPDSGNIAASGNKGRLTYKSSNTAVATVDAAGKVTAKGGGTAKITITAAETAQYNAASKTITVNVAKAAQSITAKAAAPVIFAGQTTSVSVTGAKGTRSFKSSDTTIAAVDKSTGKVTAKKAGTVKITAASTATAQYNAASKTVTIKVLPAATSSLTAANQATGIKLTWKKVPGVTGYKIYRNSTLIKTITGDSTVTYVDTKANTNMTRYIYKVVANGPAGDSPLSRSITVYRVKRPEISFAANSGPSRMTVKWTRTARATGYQIKYSTSKTFASDNGTVSAYGGTTDSRRIGDLKKGKIYYVKIRTYKVVGNGLYWSEWSPVKSVKISK